MDALYRENGAAAPPPPAFTRGVAERSKAGGSANMKHDPKNEDHARELRKDMTPWERKLWYRFLRDYPIRFQRQKCIDHYIVDFYCFLAKLVIELDGGGHYHSESQKKDQIRTRVLENYGLRVLRFCNLDIDKNFYGVCTIIDNEVKRRIENK